MNTIAENMWRKTSLTELPVLVKMLLGVLVLQVLFATCAFVVEAEFDKSFQNWAYFVFTTMSTVGYGDMAPKTPLGRSLVTWAMVMMTLLQWGTVALSLHQMETANATLKRVFNSFRRGTPFRALKVPRSVFENPE